MSGARSCAAGLVELEEAETASEDAARAGEVLRRRASRTKYRRGRPGRPGGAWSARRRRCIGGCPRKSSSAMPSACSSCAASSPISLPTAAVGAEHGRSPRCGASRDRPSRRWRCGRRRRGRGRRRAAGRAPEDVALHLGGRRGLAASTEDAGMDRAAVVERVVEIERVAPSRALSSAASGAGRRRSCSSTWLSSRPPQCRARA